MPQHSRTIVIVGAVLLLLDGLTGTTVFTDLHWQVPDLDVGSAMVELLILYLAEARLSREQPPSR